MTALARLLVAATAVIASFAAGSVASATTPDTTAAPETTPPPETTAAPTTAAPTTTTPDDGNDIDWGPIALVAALAVILIAIIAAFASRRRPSPPPSAVPRSNTYEIELLGTAQWFHDQLSLELQAATPQQAQQRWAVERSRVDGIVIGTQQQAARSNPEAWSRLGQAVSLLSGALDTSIQLRTQPEPDAALVAESAQVVNRRRAELQSLISALSPIVRGG